MQIWGIHKQYSALSWWENFMGGHLSIGPITIYGCNAMNWVVNISTKKWGYVCFTLPTYRRVFGKETFHLYCSPNGTPWACTYYIGPNKAQLIRSKIRFWQLGHKFNTDKNWTILKTINHKFEWISIHLYDIEKFGPKIEMGDYIHLEDDYSHIV